MNKKAIAAGAIIAISGLGVAACSAPTNQQQQQAVTEQYAQKLTNAEPYPISQMNNSAERANLKERLLRMNDPNKIGYFYELTQNGQVLAEYTIKGKVSSTGSTMTNTQSVVGNNALAVDTMNDDGSYGPEEGGENGVFFFTTSGVLVEWDGLWKYSDAPLSLTSKPLITMDANAKPSSTAGTLK
jgi:hypothetical protein